MSDDPGERLRRLRERLHPAIAEPTEGAAKVRRGAEKKRRLLTDGRALRATGRTQVFPFRCRPELMQRVRAVTRKRGVSIAAWMESLIEVALEGDEDA